MHSKKHPKRCVVIVGCIPPVQLAEGHTEVREILASVDQVGINARVMVFTETLG